MADALAAELVCIDSNPSIDLSDYDLIGFGSAITLPLTIYDFNDLFQVKILKVKMYSYSPPVVRPFLGAYHQPLRKIVEAKVEL